MRYDIAIIGTGPAGLSAAVNAKIRNKSFILIGDENYSEKLALAPHVENYLGLPGKSGKELGEAFSAHLKEMDIEITATRVKQVIPMGTFFGIQIQEGMIEASALVLATGIVTKKNLPGEDDYLGSGVGYCATCDGPLYRNKTVMLVGEFPEAEEDVTFMAELAEKVYYVPLYEGAKTAAELGAAASREDAASRIEVVDAKPLRVEGTEGNAFTRRANALVVQTAAGDERRIDADGIFFLKKMIPAASLVPGLAMDEEDPSAIKVKRDMSTSIPGVFACGDCTGRPYQYMKAAGEGLIAGQAAVSYVTKLAEK